MSKLRRSVEALVCPNISFPKLITEYLCYLALRDVQQTLSNEFNFGSYRSNVTNLYIKLKSLLIGFLKNEHIKYLWVPVLARMLAYFS